MAHFCSSEGLDNTGNENNVPSFRIDASPIDPERIRRRKNGA